MDDSEKLVESYLKHIGFKDVVYEPDGNVPPDFLADGRVAVEVRRLNQNHDDGQGLRGLEEDSIPLWRCVGKYLTSLGPAPSSGQSWYVYYRFSRPVPTCKALQQQLDGILQPFMGSADPQPFEAILSEGFSIRVFRAPSPKPTFFRPGGYSDGQSGGSLISEIETNLSHCIAEKTAKIANYRAKYPEWWLVLPDRIGYGLDDLEQELFRDQALVQVGGFDKVILLDPRDAMRAFEVSP